MSHATTWSWLWMLMTLAAAVVLAPHWAASLQAQATPRPNLLQGGSFDAADDKGVAQGWSLTGSAKRTAIAPRAGRDSEACQLIELAPGGAAVLAQEVVVEPGQELFVRLWVRSEGRVVVKITDQQMSYHHQGAWQQLVGVVQPGTAEKVTLEVQMRTLDDQPTAVLLDEASLVPVEEPRFTDARPRLGSTAIVDAGLPRAIIVYPAADPAYRALAERVRDAVADRTGVRLPMMADTEATEAGPPVLKRDVRDQHLILLGRLDLNRALWPAYNRFLAAADGHYPGGDGYVVRTAANVMRNQRNHLILGGTTKAGIEKAVDQFIAQVQQTHVTNGSLVMPWLLDVELGGACLAEFEATDRKWTDTPHSAELPPIEPGYNTVRRWYENVMGYYWTGWDSYRQRARDYADLVIDDSAYTHHYIVEFFVRCYDMIDDSDLLSDEQRLALDNLVRQNFWHFQTGPDAGWMTTFSPPYESIQLVNRHQIAPWYADLMLADFLSVYFPLQGDLADLVAFRRSEKMAVMDHFVEHRWGPSAPGGVTTEHEEEIAATFFRHALHHERYGFFEKGHARRALELDRLEHLRGVFTRPAGRIDHDLIMGILAHYEHDGRYATLIEKVPEVVHPMGHFQGRYICGVRRYTPGEGIEPVPATGLAGVRKPATMPHVLRRLDRFADGPFRPSDVPADEAMDFVAFRSGFDPADDYFAIHGLNALYNPGVILNFTSRDTYWMGVGASAIFSPASDRYFDQNAVHVLRTDRWQTDEKPYGSVAHHDWHANLGMRGATAFTLAPFMGTEWLRQVLWLDSGLFVVRDTIAAQEDGQYEIVVNWRPTGSPAWDGDTLTMRSRAAELRLTPMSETLRLVQNIDSYRDDPDAEAHFRLAGSAKLKRGETVGALAVLQARYPDREPAYRAEAIDEDTVRLTSEGDAQPIVVHWGPIDTPGLRSDAAVTIVRPNTIEVIGATAVYVANKPLLRAAQPVHASIDVAEGRALLDAGLDVDAPVHVEMAVRNGRVPVGPAGEGDPTEITFDASTNGAMSAALRGYIDAFDEPAVAQRDAEERNAAAQVTEATDAWQERWRYEGLQRPARVQGISRVSEGVIDLGRSVALHEVRAISRGRVFEPGKLPEVIWIAEPTAQGERPAPGDDAWQRIELDVQPHPGVRTGNYGRAEPIDDAFEFALLEGRKARYVRGEGVEGLLYYDAEAAEARQPLSVVAEDLTGDGRDEVLVKPRIWPKFIRPRYEADNAIALLDADGSERFTAEATSNYQDVALFDYLGDGTKQVVTVEDNAQIRVHQPDGEVVQAIDLYAMHERFNEEKGKPNTRHPAGGLTMPYAIGGWRRGDNRRAALVVGRYGAISFIDPTGAFDGVLMCGGYVTPAILPMGIDFDRDGQDEQVLIARGQVYKIYGDRNERVTEPQGHYFYPQVYQVARLPEPAWDAKIDGPAVVTMQTLPWGGGPRRGMLIARENYLGIYDAGSGRWMFIWTPVTKLVAAAVASAGQSELEVVAVTDDGLLWRLRWQGSLERLADFSTLSVSDAIRSAAGTPDHAGPVVLAGARGLYLLRPNEAMVRIAAGSYQDAAFVRDGAAGDLSVVATTDAGRVVRFDRRALSRRDEEGSRQ